MLAVLRICAALLALAAASVSFPAQSSPVVVPAKPIPPTVARWAQEHRFSGIVAVRPGGGDFEAFPFGLADAASGRPMTSATVFQAGSVSKYFAALTAFAMAQDGLLDLDAPIGRYLPNYRSDTGMKLTLADLLSSASGLPDELAPVVNAIPAKMRASGAASLRDLGYDELTLEEGVRRYCSGDLQFEPGTRFDYSNANWPLVHLVLQQVSGLPYESLLRKYLFEPAEMDFSGVFIGDLRGADRALDDYAVGFDPEAKFTGDYPLPEFAGGGAYTNARDLVALEDALRAGKLLDDANLKRFRSVRFPEKAYAYGGRFHEIQIGGRTRRLSAQSGSNGATRITLLYDTESGDAVVVLSNSPGGQDHMFDLSSELIERMYSRT